MHKCQHPKGTRFTAELNCQEHDETLTATNGMYSQTPKGGQRILMLLGH